MSLINLNPRKLNISVKYPHIKIQNYRIQMLPMWVYFDGVLGKDQKLLIGLPDNHMDEHGEVYKFSEHDMEHNCFTTCFNRIKTDVYISPQTLRNVSRFQRKKIFSSKDYFKL